MKHLFGNRFSLFDIFAFGLWGILVIKTHNLLIAGGFVLVAGFISVIVGRKYND